MTKKNILFLSWQGGLGHITRDLAIVKALRERNPEIHISWLAHPLACKLLREAGEEVLLENHLGADYNQAIGKAAANFGFNLMKYLLLTQTAWGQNTRLLKQVLARYSFDLIIGDEPYEVIYAMFDHKLAVECPFISIEDFICATAMTNNPLEKFGFYRLNVAWVMNKPRFLEPRLVHLFVGEPEDVLDKPFGFLLPNRLTFAKKYYHFLGYVIRFDPLEYSDKSRARAELGYGKELLLLCATGGTAAGKELITLCGNAYSILKKDNPNLRMVCVCGELYGQKPPEAPSGVEVHEYIPDLYKHYAACDMAVVVGGGTTTVELTALRKPFIYFPLENQFDQQLFVTERLARHGAGIKMRFFQTTPETLAQAIRQNIDRPVSYNPIPTDGAQRGAEVISRYLGG